MAQVRAKFRCIEKADRSTQWGASKGVQSSGVKLAAVAGPENKEWAQFTPSGQLEMQIDNPAALDAFVVGTDYFIDFTPVETEQVAPVEA
jgi:hypothetical protein